MGYLGIQGASAPPLSKLQWNFNMRSVATALAVNLGLRKLSSLVRVTQDSLRVGLMNDMIELGYISPGIAAVTWSYFDALYAPTPNIYCTSFRRTSPQCEHI